MIEPLGTTVTSYLSRAEKLLFDEAPLWLVLVLSAALGCGVALHVFGLQYVLGTSAFWSYPVGDAVTMLTGWNYFSHEGWHFPLTLTHATNPPGGVNIVYMDSIPLVAIVAKVFASVTGARFHPYGMWHCTLYGLQSVFGALLARKLGMRGLLASLACASLCLSTSAFLLRFYHEGLNAHFLVLWALLNYVRSPTTRMRSVALGWAANLFCALLIHPYLTTMCLAIATAAHVRMALVDRRRALVSGASSIGAIAVAWIGAGYAFQRANQGEAAVFGLSSLNLMSPVIPYYSAFFGSWLPPATIQEATGYQWDGTNFLGFGVIALVLVSLVSAHRRVLQLVRAHWCLCLVLLVLAAYAPGNRWAIGQRILFEIPLSDRMRSTLATFRGTGRFFWPVGYAIAIASATIVVRRFGRRGVLALAAAALFQLADSSASWKIISGAFVASDKRLLEWDRWARAIDGHAVVAAYPSYSCQPGGTLPRTYDIEREIEFMAAAHGKHTIDSRTARSFIDCSKQPAEIESFLQSGLAPDTLYVLFRPVFDEERTERFGRDQCVDFGDGWLCSAAHHDALESAFH